MFQFKSETDAGAAAAPDRLREGQDGGDGEVAEAPRAHVSWSIE